MTYTQNTHSYTCLVHRTTHASFLIAQRRSSINNKKIITIYISASFILHSKYFPVIDAATSLSSKKKNKSRNQLAWCMHTVQSITTNGIYWLGKKDNGCSIALREKWDCYSWENYIRTTRNCRFNSISDHYT